MRTASRIAASLVVVLGFHASIAAQGVAVTTRVSVSSAGAQGNGNSLSPGISADGRYVVFESSAGTLVAGDTNGVSDVFVHDRTTGATTRVSVASNGTQGNGPSSLPVISADGRYVAFMSGATNLVAGGTKNWGEVFVHDRATGTTTHVSVSTAGAQGNSSSNRPSISDDGRYVAFETWASNLTANDTNTERDVLVRDRTAGTTTRVSVSTAGGQGNGESSYAAISGDGRYVSFMSYADTLVGGDTNNRVDCFVHDRVAGTTTRVSVASDGAQGNQNSTQSDLSTDGRYVAFTSNASNLVPNDTNGTTDVFVHDRTTGVTTRVNVSSTGVQASQSSRNVALSGDGAVVAFVSLSSNLVAGDTNYLEDVFVHERSSGTTTRVSVAADGTEGNSAAEYGALSSDGRLVAFVSLSSNLVSGDTNEARDIFVRDRGVAAPTVTSVEPAQGPRAGGTDVVVTGTGFVAGASVSFGGAAATGVTVSSATIITARTPPHAIGTVDVVVQNGDTQSGTLPGGFTYYLFTDAPLVPGVTPIRAVHVTELRGAIGELRTREGLGQYAWTDTVLAPHATVVAGVHLVELRTALTEVYTAMGRPEPSWTPPTVVARATIVTAAQIEELRAAVLAVW